MSDSDEAVHALKRATEALTEALNRMTDSIQHGPGMAHIATGHPRAVELLEALHRLAALNRAVLEKMNTLTDTQFQQLLDRPSIDRDDRNTRDDSPAGSDEDDAARV